MEYIQDTLDQTTELLENAAELLASLPSEGVDNLSLKTAQVMVRDLHTVVKSINRRRIRNTNRIRRIQLHSGETT